MPDRKGKSRELTDAERERYAALKLRTFGFAEKAALALRKRHEPRTAYSIAKETRRLAAAGAAGVKPVSANAIRGNDLCAKLLTDEIKRRVFQSADGPRDMDRMTRNEAIEQAKRDRAWAIDSSQRLIEAENENARLRLEIRELRKRV